MGVHDGANCLGFVVEGFEIGRVLLHVHPHVRCPLHHRDKLEQYWLDDQYEDELHGESSREEGWNEPHWVGEGDHCNN